MNASDEDLADNISRVVSDYRSHDGIKISAADVLEWAHQFDEKDHNLMLSETLGILNQRYISKAAGQNFLNSLLRQLPSKAGFASAEEFWRNANFLNLQPPGKSQRVMLDLLWDTAETQFGLERQAAGIDSSKVIVYLDDVLCTGNTLFLAMKEWLEEEVAGAQRRSKLASDTTFVLAHFIVHALNLRKVKGRFYHMDQTSPFWFNQNWHAITVDNNYESPSASLDFVFPEKDGLSEAVLAYYNSIGGSEYGTFRPLGRPPEEKFFSSPSNRRRFEQVLVEKGVELLSGVSNPKPNMRPLGFTLPSHKTLGFGALAFTWRNVPNNTPLVFWYAPRGWKPLFPKR